MELFTIQDDWKLGPHPEPPLADIRKVQFRVTFEQIFTLKMVNQNKEHSLFAIDNKQRQSIESISSIMELSRLKNYPHPLTIVPFSNVIIKC